MTSRSVASLGIFAALVAAVGFALSGVPNVELMSLMIFVAGAVLGPGHGALVGVVGMGIYSGFNPYGLAPPPTFLSQLLGAAGIGAAGGWLAHGDRLGRGARAAAIGAGLGAVLTLAYDVVTNLGTALTMGAALDPWPIVWGGVVFSVLHIVWNTIFFAIGLPALLAVRRRREARVP